MTMRLYYDSPYMKKCQARIVGVSPHPNEDASILVLDRTIFYPGGGGQPSDRGYIAGGAIIGMEKTAGKYSPNGEPEIAHIVEGGGNFKVGDGVEIVLDWGRRLDYMQQHSGQHIISAVFGYTGGYGTESVRFGEELSSIEFDADAIPDEVIAQCTDIANTVIMASLPIHSRLTSPNELKKLLLRREPVVAENVRVVEIASLPTSFGENMEMGGCFDRSACGGIHVRNSSEARLIEYIAKEKIRRRLRLYWKIGNRALHDYRNKTDICTRLGAMLSLPADKIHGRVEQLQKENVDLRRQVLDLQKKAIERELSSQLERGHGRAGKPPFLLLVDDASTSMLREMGQQLQQQGLERAVLLSQSENRVYWLVFDARTEHLNFSLLKASILDPESIKGGGRAPFWQGSAGTQCNIHDLSESLLGFIDQ